MELIAVITVLCMGLSVLLTPCTSDQIQVQPTHELVHELKVTLPALPRKLKVNEENTAVKGNADEDLVSKNKLKVALSGKPQHKEADTIHASKGTWQEWAEGADASQYFTMDYSHVKRRRPIHNKSVPVGP